MYRVFGAAPHSGFSHAGRAYIGISFSSLPSAFAVYLCLCDCGAIEVFRIQIFGLYGLKRRSKDTHKVRQICNLFILLRTNTPYSMEGDARATPKGI